MSDVSASELRLVTDKAAIDALIQGWMFRDIGQWDKLRTLFHPDGRMEASWFQGLFSDFVDASMRMGASNLRTKHVMGTPIISLTSDKAIAETNAIIVCDNAALQLGCNAHGRFFDLIERRDRKWKILKRHFFYDMSAFTFPNGPIEIDADAAKHYPHEYAALAYVLEKSGFPVTRRLATRNSEAERAIRSAGQAWFDAPGNDASATVR
jgi:hypothetical protein